MQYQVPQFIEVEDKIFGPLTFKQFIYLLAGGGLCLMFYTLFPIYVALFLAMPVVALAFALAFYEVNGRPFIVAIEHGFYYAVSKKLYLWKQRPPETKAPVDASLTPALVTGNIPKLTQSKLKDLSWSLNIKDRGTMGVTDKQASGFEL